MNDWLSRTEVVTIASELLSQKYSDRIQERIAYIHNFYSDKYTSNDLLEKIIEIIKHYRDHFDEQILNYKEPVRFATIAEEAENYRKSIRAKPETDYTQPSKTEEQIIHLRENYKIPRLILIGNYVKGLRGEISRNEVERILQQIFEAKTKINEKKVIINEPISHKEIKDSEIESLSELLGDNLDKCIQLLIDVLKEENRHPLDVNGRWTKKRSDLSILVAWMDALRQAGKFKSNTISDKKKSELLNNQFSGINFKIDDTSMWRKPTRVYESYKQIFDRMLK